MKYKKNHTIKSIFFDLDHTLVDCATADKRTYEILATIARKQLDTINTPSLIHDFRQLLIKQPFDPDGRIDVHTWRIDLWTQALSKQNIDHEDLARQLNHAFHFERLAFYVLDHSVQTLLNDLLQTYTGIIITNGDTTIQRPKLAACNAHQYFGQNIIVGGEEPHEKPHASIFEKACDMADCSPQEAIMVGDRLHTDIQGGINAGLAATVWVNPNNDPLDHNGPEPHFQVVSVLELPAILSGLHK
ncbi:MAG: N-acylneuraminate-9-phosphatase [Candidatus Magnetoglobus multicellularis str. Araruama]|uniref:N-acylneuraminate-9-phosphatase n=1 Tax=Candidatus Magnetoglobus multicellularis str. Araruama TaxID=890399 RepID=A0A1V1P9A0_9BACT|nr:MAG: N-acylneuraminate-9-phosphatase [Candidatus Magnetoglobus multicellularis str. Araruama]